MKSYSSVSKSGFGVSHASSHQPLMLQTVNSSQAPNTGASAFRRTVHRSTGSPLSSEPSCCISFFTSQPMAHHMFAQTEIAAGTNSDSDQSAPHATDLMRRMEYGPLHVGHVGGRIPKHSSLDPPLSFEKLVGRRKR